MAQHSKRASRPGTKFEFDRSSLFALSLIGCQMPMAPLRAFAPRREMGFIIQAAGLAKAQRPQRGNYSAMATLWSVREWRRVLLYVPCYKHPDSVYAIQNRLISQCFSI